MNENLTVTYTNEDDGIWLQCDKCGTYLENLGYWPPVHYIVEKASRYENSHQH